MTLRRLFVGVAVVLGLSVWSWCRADGPATQTPAPTADVVYAADAAGESASGNYDEAAHRYRTNQPYHWRHVIIGNH